MGSETMTNHQLKTMVIVYVILLVFGLSGLEVEQIPNKALFEGDSVMLICSGKPWKKPGGWCEIKQVGKPNVVFGREWKDNTTKNSYGLNEDKALKKRFKVGVRSKCSIRIKKLCLHDAGEWTCDIFSPDDNTTETGTFDLTNIESSNSTAKDDDICLLPTTPATITATETDSESLITTMDSSTETEQSTDMDSESPSIGVIIGLIITIIFGFVITIVVLAYFDIIKRFRFLPRRSPGLRQVDEMKRESDLRKRFRQSMHTFLDYVEKQTGSRS